MKDEDIYEVFVNETWRETELYKKCLKITRVLDSMSNREILSLIIKEFDIINKLILVGNVEERLAKLEYFINNATSLNNFGMDIYDMSDYFEEVLSSDNDIKMASSKNAGNSVKIMTIHKSKGLEYNYVYLPFLGSNFNKKVDHSKFKFALKYGIITPFYDNGRGDTFVEKLFNKNELIEELSEKIRLFYVALTRAKEKIIMVTSFDEKIEAIDGDMNLDDLEKVNSYSYMLSLLKNKVSKYIRNINIDDLDVNMDYNDVKSSNYKDKIVKTKDIIKVKPLAINNTLLEQKHFSKKLSKVIDKDLKQLLDFGTFMHYVFEVYDFKQDNLDELEIDEKYKEMVRNFLNHPETKDINKANIYKEHEIYFESDGATFHGFIDLLVEYPDHFDIIDYKLSNIKSEEYKLQLAGYKDYIEKKYHKKVVTYLYSIKKDEFLMIN